MALTSVNALNEHLHRFASAIELPARGDDIDRYRSELMAEFELFQRVLQRAADEGQQFRFLIVP